MLLPNIEFRMLLPQELDMLVERAFRPNMFMIPLLIPSTVGVGAVKTLFIGLSSLFPKCDKTMQNSIIVAYDLSKLRGIAKYRRQYEGGDRPPVKI